MWPAGTYVQWFDGAEAGDGWIVRPRANGTGYIVRTRTGAEVSVGSAIITNLPPLTSTRDVPMGGERLPPIPPPTAPRAVIPVASIPIPRAKPPVPTSVAVDAWDGSSATEAPAVTAGAMANPPIPGRKPAPPALAGQGGASGGLLWWLAAAAAAATAALA